MDINTGLIVLGTAVGSKELVVKLLGPTAEYLGDGLKGWAERRLENVAGIFHRAERIAGERIESPGSVPPRVLKEVLDEGSFCDDALMAEYFGGILASAKSDDESDDRATAYAALVSRLSTYQIRTHYLLYRLLKELYNGGDMKIGEQRQRLQMQIFVPLSVYSQVVGIPEREHERLWAVLSHSHRGLAKEDLLDGSNYALGSAEHIRANSPFKDAESSGFTFTPSVFGVDLFMWVHGHPNMLIGKFLSPDTIFRADVPIEIPQGYRRQ